MAVVPFGKKVWRKALMLMLVDIVSTRKTPLEMWLLNLWLDIGRIYGIKQEAVSDVAT